MVHVRSELMAAMGRAGDPPMRRSIPIGDLAAPITSVVGIFSALLHHEKSGMGQFIDQQ